MPEVTNKRHSGYVVGHTPTPHGGYWTVKVKDPTDPKNGKKLKVLPSPNPTPLASGINVTFLIGTVDGPNETRFEKAFDVQLA